MGVAHIAHDCQIGNHCTITNYCGISGHVILEDYAYLGA